MVAKIRKSIQMHDQKQCDIMANEQFKNPKVYWQALRSTIKNRKQSVVPPLVVDDNIVSDPVQNANLFNDYFVEQTRLNENNSGLPNTYPSVNSTLNHFNISEYEVYKVLYDADPTKATGPDGIGNKLLKETASVIAKPLAFIYNKSIELGKFPSAWKIAHVSVLHKKGSVFDCSNYGPISLLSCISKTFEKVIFKHVYAYLTQHKLISSVQSGFRPGDSTIRQLVSICDKIHTNLDDGHEILSAFLDFRKAFDKVWHKGLTFKLTKDWHIRITFEMVHG